MTVKYTPEIESDIQKKTLQLLDYLDSYIYSLNALEFLPFKITHSLNDKKSDRPLQLIISKENEQEKSLTYKLVYKDDIEGFYSLDLRTFEEVIKPREFEGYEKEFYSTFMTTEYYQRIKKDDVFYAHETVYKKLLLHWNTALENYPNGFKGFIIENLNFIFDTSHLKYFKV